MTKSIIPINYKLFLKDFKSFEEFLLPLINKQRQEAGESILEGADAMDHYLDLFNKHKDDRSEKD